MNTLSKILNKFKKTQFDVTIGKKTKAMSLIEVVLALLVVLVIIGSVGYNYMTATRNSNIADTQSNLIVMRSQINQLGSGMSSYEGMDNDLVLKAGLAPQVFVSAGKLINPFGGEINVTTEDPFDTFKIEITSLDSEVCVSIASFQTESWVSVEINGEVVSDVDLVANIATIVDKCSKDGTTNNIIFEAR